MRRFCLVALLLILVACAPEGETPVATTAPVAEVSPTTVSASPTPLAPTAEPATTTREEGTESPAPPSPTAPAPATATLAQPATASPATAGYTGEGAYYLGDPGAAVTIIDYSDFL